MIKGNCKQCEKEIIRAGSKPPVFCGLPCKGEWQRTQKPVDKEWLHQKYIVEKLSTYQIGAIVKRDPKRVHCWLKDYGIPTRSRPGRPNHAVPLHRDYWDKEWLYNQYITLGKSAMEIAQDQSCHENNILHFLKKHQIPARTMSQIRAVKHWSLSGELNGMFGKRGPEVPSWKGGVTPERQAFYSSPEWSKVVGLVWGRDKNTCQRCGKTREDGYTMNVHHIVSFAKKELRATLSNLILLCEKCHRWTHSKKNTKGEFIKDVS